MCVCAACVHALSPAVVAVEVIRMVGVVLEQQRMLFNDGVTLLTDVLAQATSLLSVVTRTTQVPNGRERVRERQSPDISSIRLTKEQQHKLSIFS